MTKAEYLQRIKAVDEFDPALDEFVYDSTEYDWDADAWLGQGEDRVVAEDEEQEREEEA